MKWFDKWFANKVKQAWEDARQENEQEPMATGIGLINPSRARATKVRETEHFSSDPIQFKMYKASGGWAIEFRHYDSNTDRVHTALYVVNGEEELGNNISQIITMEALKR